MFPRSPLKNTRLHPFQLGLLALLSLLLAGPITGEEALQRALDSIRGDEALKHVRQLADDKLAGRALASQGELEAARYLAARLAACKVQPAGDDNTFLQSFLAYPSLKAGPGCRLNARSGRSDVELAVGSEFQPYGFSPSSGADGRLVFAGYGVTAGEAGYDDYQGSSVKGRIVLVLAGAPSISGMSELERVRHGWAIQKAGNAAQHNAAGLIIVAPTNTLDALADDGLEAAGIPVVQITRQAAGRILGEGPHALKELERRTTSPDASGTAVALNVRCALTTELIQEGRPTRNVLGVVPGVDPVLKEEVVVLAAHYDHVGRGEYGSLSPERRGEIHNGADDNASGVAALLEVAEAFQVSGLKPRRTVLFALFTGEELGNVGSRYYVSRPARPLEQTVAMINLDMVGRGETGAFVVWGAGTAAGLKDRLLQAEAELEQQTKQELAIQYGDQDVGRGDNTALYRRGIPALLFHTGRHDQYHTPDDDWQRINTANLELIARMAFVTLHDLTEADRRPVFQPSEFPPRQYPMLGMEAGQEVGDGMGVEVAWVMGGSAADRAGLRRQDRIVALFGHPTPGMHALVTVLKRLPVGHSGPLTVVRNDQLVELEVELGAHD